MFFFFFNTIKLVVLYYLQIESTHKQCLRGTEKMNRKKNSVLKKCSYDNNRRVLYCFILFPIKQTDRHNSSMLQICAPRASVRQIKYEYPKLLNFYRESITFAISFEIYIVPCRPVRLLLNKYECFTNKNRIVNHNIIMHTCTLSVMS